jgi:hypothetical protein
MKKDDKDLDKVGNNVMEEKKDLGQNDFLEKTFEQTVQEIPETKKEKKVSETKGTSDLFPSQSGSGDKRK